MRHWLTILTKATRLMHSGGPQCEYRPIASFEIECMLSEV